MTTYRVAIAATYDAEQTVHVLEAKTPQAAVKEAASRMGKVVKGEYKASRPTWGVIHNGSSVKGCTVGNWQIV